MTNAATRTPSPRLRNRIHQLGQLPRKLALLLAICFVGLSYSTRAVAAGSEAVTQDTEHKTVTITTGDGSLTLRVNYDGKCVLDRVIVRGREVAAATGVSSGICVAGSWYTTKALVTPPRLRIHEGVVSIDNITFGPPQAEIHESWVFRQSAAGIEWTIERLYNDPTAVDDTAVPQWDFADMSTWTGGLLDNGGIVLTNYLESPNMTYGAHSRAVTFWNRTTHDCLRIAPSSSELAETLARSRYGSASAARFSHQPAGPDNKQRFSFDYEVSPGDLQPKYDFTRFLGDHQDLWKPFRVNPSTVIVVLSLDSPQYDEVFERGTFPGIDSDAVSQILNTVGRYGVIDNHLVGANGWRTGNICLHEQWFAEIGLALADPNYDANLASTLDFERDHAIGADGRVIARWSYNAGDAMAGTFDTNGFYEAQWGYLIDSQPDYVINVAEQFDRTDDLKWLTGQKTACEKALDYLVRREVGHSGLVTVLTDSHLQRRGSDWFDVIWVSYENALVNAEMYEALTLWSEREEILGDSVHAASYRAFAARLKASFNKPIADGGFWDPVNKWYVYWREKDGSIHGNNLFTPVNFAAIAYGVCDDPVRKKAILDRIETETNKEKLFAWPTNIFTFQPGDAMRRNYPFPNYENGAIFLSWAELGVRAYASYRPDIALKYIRNLIEKYNADGLAFQRYERKTQQGAGDDLLSGNCMAIVGLYRDIYGIQPKADHLLLDPHLTPDLDGTTLRYPLQDGGYLIGLSTHGCSVSGAGSTLHALAPFGVYAGYASLRYYSGRSSSCSLAVTGSSNGNLHVTISNWPTDPGATRRWTEMDGSFCRESEHSLANLRPGAAYLLVVNGKPRTLRADKTGRIHFATMREAGATQTFELSKAGKVVGRRLSRVAIDE